MARASLDQYKHQVERFGPEGVLEAAKHDLSEEEFAQLDRLIHPPKKRGRKKKKT